MFQKILQDKFIKDNTIFFSGSIIIAILNYLYHPVMSRMMSVREFGEVQTIISLTYITNIFLVIIGTIVINIIANRSDNKSNVILAQLYKLSLGLVFFLSVLIISLSPYLKQVFQFESIGPFFLLTLILIIGVPFIFYNSYLRGRQQFKSISIAGIILAAGKLIFAWGLVFLGFKVFGAVSALVLAILIALLYVKYKTKGIFYLNLKERLFFSIELRKELKYGLLIFISLGFVTFLYTSDVLFVKHFFAPREAGLYSGIATVARIIFFATASVAGVLLPSIKMNASKKQNYKILKKAFIIIFLLGSSILVIFSLMSKIIISTLMGGAYVGLAELLPLAGLYIFLVSLINIMYMYFLALRDRKLFIISLIGFFITVSMLFARHNTFEWVIIDYIIGILATISMLGVNFYKNWR